MTVRLSIGVQAHPSRRAAAIAIARAAGGRVVWDPSPNGVRSTWRSNRLLWAQTPRGATHRLCLQDDVVVCRGFREAARSALAAHPDELVAFFAPAMLQNVVHQQAVALQAGHPWAVVPVEGFVPMQALAMPAGMVRAMLAWTDQHPYRRTGMVSWTSSGNVQQARPNDDEIVARWARHAGIELWVTVPSLVDHDVGVPSTLGNDDLQGRAARFLVPPGTDARDLAW